MSRAALSTRSAASPPTRRLRLAQAPLPMIGKGFARRSLNNPWEAAGTDRMNQHQWAGAVDASVNRALVLYLETLRARTQLEMSRNPILAGVAETIVTDTVGVAGPTLQAQSENREYVDRFEQVFWEWSQSPDMSGMLSLAEMISLWVRQLPTCGEYLVQITVAPAAERNVELNQTLRKIAIRTVQIDPRRLRTPCARAADEHMVMGVERNEHGKPQIYWISPPDDGVLGPMRYDEKGIPAGEIIHDFRLLQPGQGRGIPEFATCLQSSADLREFDRATLLAAKAAAKFSVLLYTENDENFVVMNEEAEIQDQMMSTLPPGYKAAQIKAEHPSTQYTEFRKERLREMGRPFGMPLMMVIQDAGGHNYSSARFDGQVYQRVIKKLQSRIASKALNRLARAVAREAALQGLTPRVPDDLDFNWTWPVMPHVDPDSEAKAIATRLRENKTMSFAEACAQEGKDWQQVLRERKAESDFAKQLGVEDPHKAKALPALPAAASAEDTEEDTTGDKDTDKDADTTKSTKPARPKRAKKSKEADDAEASDD